MNLDDDAIKSFSQIEGVQAILPKYEAYDYTVGAYAGANQRYANTDWLPLIGVDTEALESMGYEFVEGETAGKGKDEAVAGQFLPMRSKILFCRTAATRLITGRQSTMNRAGRSKIPFIRIRISI